MLRRCLRIAGFLLLVTPVMAVDGPRGTADVDRLVTQLGDDDFETRVTATEKLTAIGEKALPALHKAIRTEDPEVVYRAKKAIVAIEKTVMREIHVCKGHTGQILTVAFDKEGKRCASGSFDTTIRVWDVATGKELHKLEGHKDIVFCVCFSPDGKYLLSSSGGSYVDGKWGEGTDYSIRLWDLKTGKEVRRFGEKHKDWVLSVCFSPDGKMIASSTRNKDTTIRIWDFETGKVLKEMIGSDSGVRSVSFSSDGKELVSGGYDNAIRVWNVEAGKSILTLRPHQNWVDRVVFSPDGKTMLSGSRDNTIRWWRTDGGRHLQTIREHRDHVLCVAFLPDGQRGLSSSGDGTVRLWDLNSGIELARLEGHKNVVDALAVTTDGQRAASGGKDGTVRIWRLPP